MASKSKSSFPSSVPSYSGLETPGMREAYCSLLIPSGGSFRSEVIGLEPTRIKIEPDSSLNAKEITVNFPGCDIVHLSKIDESHDSVKSWPMTIAGKCRFTRDDQKRFRSAYRNHAENRATGMEPHSDVEWPGVQAVTLCPICNTQQSIGGVYWMVIYFMVQRQTPPSSSLKARQICRLMCMECMEHISENVTVEINMEKPFKQLLEDTSYLCTAMPDSPSSFCILNAWDLNWHWTQTGAWAALCQYTGELVRSKEDELSLLKASPSFDNSVESNVSFSPARTSLSSSSSVDCSSCSKKNKVGAAKKCPRCKVTSYCSRKCQKSDWQRHKRAECRSNLEKSSGDA